MDDNSFFLIWEGKRFREFFVHSLALKTEICYRNGKNHNKRK